MPPSPCDENSFFTDTHTAAFPAGAVRGQLDLVDTVYNK
jgi:hypothetical protein